MRYERARVMGASVRRFFCGGFAGSSSRSRESSRTIGSAGEPNDMLGRLRRVRGDDASPVGESGSRLPEDFVGVR